MTKLWVAMDTMQFYVIQTGLFRRKQEFLVFSGLTDMSNCPLVQGKSNKPPPPLPSIGVCVGGGGGGANSYSMILPLFLVSWILMNMLMR